MSKVRLLYDFEYSKAKRGFCGGRVATIRATLAEFAKLVGNPHEASWEATFPNFTGVRADFDGKVNAVWYFETPKGLVQVTDYWWNKEDELSVRVSDTKAITYFKGWCKAQNLTFYVGTPR